MINNQNTLYEFIAKKRDHQKRIDVFLYQTFKKIKKNISRNFIQEHLYNIKINGSKIKKKNTKVYLNDKITYHFNLCLDYLNPFSKIKSPTQFKIEFLYEDHSLFIIHKPKYLLCHPTFTSKEKTLLHCIQDKLILFEKEYLSFLDQIKDNPIHFLSKKEFNVYLRPGLVHRLDRDCSGILTLAKNWTSQKMLMNLFKERKVKKLYVALVKGIVPKEGKWTNPIGRNPKNRRKLSILKNSINPQDAETHFKRIKLFKRSKNKFSLVKINIPTGRRHQIRVHFSQNGYPIIGDPLYSSINKSYEKLGLALFAYYIKFKHPITHKKILIKLSFPEFFKKICHSIY